MKINPNIITGTYIRQLNNNKCRTISIAISYARYWDVSGKIIIIIIHESRSWLWKHFLAKNVSGSESIMQDWKKNHMIDFDLFTIHTQNNNAWIVTRYRSECKKLNISWKGIVANYRQSNIYEIFDEKSKYRFEKFCAKISS